MKFLKWLVVGLVSLVVIIGIGLVVIVNSVDWNDYRETIQEQALKHTGRDLIIAGDLKPSFFPWTGISIGGVTLANAEGFEGDTFAMVESADVKVEVLPLIKREINVRSVELHGLNVNLQRNAQGVTNWDDLTQRESTTTTETEEGTTTEVEGNTPTIAALAVGGINISGANVSWQDDMAGTDVKLSDFALETGKIELNKPFDFSSTFDINSNSMGLQAGVKALAEVSVDLDNQVYGLKGLGLDLDAKGEAFPNGALVAALTGNLVAELGNETVDVSGLVLKTMGMELTADAKVTGLNTEPVVVATLKSNDFNPTDVMAALGAELPEMADASVMSVGSMAMNINATAQSLAIDNIVIRLDDSNITGSASVPNLAAATPPIRFDLTLDSIDADRYLAPVSDTAGDSGSTDTSTTTASSDGDAPLDLPLEMIRTLDIDGSLKAGQIKVANLTTQDLVVPIKAQNGVVGLDGISAALYQGQLTATSKLDATGDTPRMAAAFNLSGIQAEPLLMDLNQADSPISGGGNIAFDITTGGNSINAIKAALNGNLKTEFTDGALNGVNIGYQLRRAKAFLTGKKLPEQADVKKTDFSSLSVSGVFTNGVLDSSDLDMRSPLLRLGGAGQFDLPQENIDYTANITVAASTEGQGGGDLDEVAGLTLEIPIKATFAQFSANPAKVIFDGVKDNLLGNLKAQADQLKAQATAALKAKEAEARASLKAEEARAKAKLDAAKADARAQLDAKEAEARAAVAAQQQAVQAKADAEKAKAEQTLKAEADKAKDKLKKGLGGLFGN